MIPANVDYVAIFNDLNSWGVSDYKIEAICGLSESYILHIRDGRVKQMTYQRAARVYNFWFEERQQREGERAAEPDKSRVALLTT